MAIGSSKLLEVYGITTLLTNLRDYFAPDAMGAAYQDARQLLLFCGTVQTMGDNLVKFGSGRTNKTRGGLFPCSLLFCDFRMRICRAAAIRWFDGNLAMKDVTQQMHRLFGPMGASGIQDVLRVDDNGADRSLLAAPILYRKAQRK